MQIRLVRDPFVPYGPHRTQPDTVFGLTLHGNAQQPAGKIEVFDPAVEQFFEQDGDVEGLVRPAKTSYGEYETRAPKSIDA